MNQAALAGSPHTANGDPFDDALLNNAYERIREGLIDDGMNDLIAGLQARRLSAGTEEWTHVVRRCLRHPLRALLHEDPFTERAFTKPRGYAGDAPLLDFIYGYEEGWPAPEGTSELGRKIFGYTTRSVASEGVRARRGFIAEVVDRLVHEVAQPHVLSVAAGHLREALLSAAVKRRKLGRYLALDWDRHSLTEVERCYAAYGVEVLPGSVRQLLTGRVQLGQFDLVYSTGLFDYVQQTTGRRLVWSLFQMLRPRGRLIIANFLPGIPDVGYMESYMGWNLIYRTRQEMLEMTLDIPEATIREIRLFAEESRNILFLEVTRN